MKQNVKVFEKKGDITASISGQPIFLQCGVDAGYALTNHVGINTSYNRFNTSLYGGENNPFVKDFIWDNELILYQNYKFGLFGAANLGYGLGGFNIGNPYYRLTLNRFYAQPSVGYMLFNRIGVVFSARFTTATYLLKTKISGYSDTETQLMHASFQLNDFDKSKTFFEPAITFIRKTKSGIWKIQMVNSHYSFEDANLVITYGFDLKKLFKTN